MGISALGIGSGLDLDSLLTQLMQVERGPKMAALDKRESEAKVQISALGSLRSAMNELRDPLRTLSNPDRMEARAATVNNPDKDNPYFTMESSRSAARGNYMVEVLKLAQGTRAQSGAFNSTEDVLSNQDGTLTFATADGESSFSVDLGAGATLEEIARKINESKDNFGVSASLINTGGANPETRLVFTSNETGANKELSVSNNNADLDSISTVASGAGNAGMSIRAEDRASDAHIKIDGIDAYSATNTFENVIQNSSITIERLTEADKPIKASIDYDKSGVKKAIEDFVKAYNGMIDNINKSTAYKPAGEDGKNNSGPLMGDALVRSIQGSFSSVVSGAAGSGEINTLFQLGLTFDKEGKLEWNTKSTGSLGTGKERLDKALEENFGAISEFFAGPNGIATQLDNLVEQFGQSGGLLDTRRNAVEMQQKSIRDERENFEKYLASYEETQRMRFAALDKTISNLNNGANMLFAQLGFG